MRRATSAVLAMVLAFGLTHLSAQQSGGPREGITVHGHWVIDVRNPDGTLVTHRDFENALQPNNALGLLLTGQQAFGGWMILIGDSTAATDPCRVAAGYQCALVEPDMARQFGTLDNFAVLSVAGASDIVLTGTFRVPLAGRITRVSTLTRSCDRIMSVADCRAADVGVMRDRPFSGTTVAPIDVVAGQSVDVQVVLSFS